MASVTHRVATTSTANATSYASAAFTPTVGDLLVAFVFASGTAAVGTTLVASANGMTFTRLTASPTRAGGADTMWAFVSNQLVPASPVSMTVTFDCAADPATGAVIAVASVSGMTKTGLTAIRQSGSMSEYSIANPAFRFPTTPLVANPQLVATANGSVGGPAVTPPTGFTEAADVSYITPDRGLEYAWRNSGGAQSTVQWRSSSSTASCNMGVELDSSSSTPPDPITPFVVGVTINGSDDTAGLASVTPAMPTGWLPNDMLLLAVELNGASRTFTGKPAGYTEIRDSSAAGLNGQFYLAYRFAQVGDTAPTVTFSASDTCTGVLIAIRNIDTSDPFGTADTHTDTAAASTITFPDVTPRYSDDFLVRIAGIRTTTTAVVRELTDPGGGTGGTIVRIVDASSFSIAGKSNGVAAWAQQLTAVTAPGADTSTATLSTVDFSAESICFKSRRYSDPLPYSPVRRLLPILVR